MTTTTDTFTTIDRTTLQFVMNQTSEVYSTDPAVDGGRKEVVFIDTSVADYQILAASIRPGVEVELIGGGDDGLAQMAEWAKNHHDYDAIHLISHGAPGAVRIGTNTVTGFSLSTGMVQAEWIAIGAALKPDGDLLLYGCDVAAGSHGQDFIHSLGQLTGADVAASTDLTGDPSLGGDWILEASTAPIEISTALTGDIVGGYHHLLDVAPALTAVSTLSDPNALEDHPFIISYATLAAAAMGFVDADLDPLSFRIKAVSSGTLTKNGTLVTNDVTSIASGESLIWTPASDANGTLNAFTVVAKDPSGLVSSSPVQVKVTILPVNDAPTLTTVSTLTGATEDQPFTILYADLVAAGNEFDVDNDPLSFRIETVSSSGVLTKGGSAVTPGVTALASGESLVWTPTSNANGTHNAFSVVALDASSTSSPAVPVQVTITAVNDLPTGLPSVAGTLAGAPTQGQTLIASPNTLSDADGLPGLILYQWQSSSNGNIWSDISGATTFQYTLAEAQVGKLMRVTAGYTDGDGTKEPSVSSLPTMVVVNVNDAPAGRDETVSTLEDTAYTFTLDDFGFTDPDNAYNPSANRLLAVKISNLTLPANSTLKRTDTGAMVIANDVISATDITAGKLVFTPAPNGNGTTYASLAFQVQDDSGTGTELDPTPNTITLNVTAVSDAPSGNPTIISVGEVNHELNATNISTITTSTTTTYTVNTILPIPPATDKTYTTTTTDTTTTTISTPSTITTSSASTNSISGISNLLPIPPPPNTSAPQITRFYTLTIADFGFTDQPPPGGTSDVDIITVPNTGTLSHSGTNTIIPITVVPTTITLNDIAKGSLKFYPASNVDYVRFGFREQNDDRTFNEDASYTLTVADFGFTDPDGDAFLAAKITIPPIAGKFQPINGMTVSAGNFISAADIATGKLVFMPDNNANGMSYANFTFQVQDNGGVANGGINIDPTPQRIVFNVTPVNDAPAGADKSISFNGGTGTYAFVATDFGFTDPKDGGSPNVLKAVTIDTLPTVGKLRLITVAATTNVVVGQSVAAAEINGGHLLFTTDGNTDNSSGPNYARFTFQVQDNGGTTNGGIDLDPTPKTITFNALTPLNHAPDSTDSSLICKEGSSYIFKVGDFHFSDSGDNPPNNLKEVKITTLPTVGTLSNINTTAVLKAGDPVSAVDINAGYLVFTPAGNGDNYAKFTFQVRDDSGSTTSGLDPTANTITFNVTPRNYAPSGDNNTISFNEGDKYTFTAADFKFHDDPRDIPLNNLSTVKIIMLPASTSGTLTLSDVKISTALISVDKITAGYLVFDPGTANTDANGNNYAKFTFQVADDGTPSLTDPTPRTITFNVTAVNDTPAGANNTKTLNEDNSYIFTIADFGFTDTKDTPANILKAVKITTLSNTGALIYNGSAVTVGVLVPAADITAGKLIFNPLANTSGTVSGLTFQVQDDGGTSNGGIDLDPTPRSITFNVTSVNDAPAGTDKTIILNEDNSGYSLTKDDFSLSDPIDSALPNLLFAVKIATLPAAGTLKLNGTQISANTFVSVADIIANKLVFTPAVNANNATNYASFTFQVQDDGKTANGGVDLDPTANTITFNVTPVNDPPVGANKVININEDLRYSPTVAGYPLTVADFGFTDPNDTPANTLLAVKIIPQSSTSPNPSSGGPVLAVPGGPPNPYLGTLNLNGVPVTPNQFVSATDIGLGNLVYIPPTNANGANYVQFNFLLQDNGGGDANNLESMPGHTIIFNIAAVNDPPVGTDSSTSFNEGNSYALLTGDFGFTDPSDTPKNSLKAVKISTLPTLGTLKLNSGAVTLGQLINAADIDAGKLVFTPAAVNANGTAYASLTFQVQDDGGTTNGGVDLDPMAHMLVFNVKSVNNAPAGTDKTLSLNEGGSYAFTKEDFGLTDLNDTPPNNLLAVKIVMLPAVGTLQIVNSSTPTAVTAGQLVTADQIAAGYLVFTPATNANGRIYARFTFQVQDDGGVANSGVDLDPTSNTITFDVTSVNDAPTGADKTVNFNEDSPYTFTTANFGFTDTNDTPANVLKAVNITTLPAVGTLKLSGSAVTAGQSVSTTDMDAGKLVFTPAANANGTTDFTFQVQDDGGIANGGIDLDPTAKRITLSVMSVNDAPGGANKTVSINEDSTYPFATTDFGFNDLNDTPPNNPQAVKITTLPSAGTLRLGDIAATTGQLISATDITAGKLLFIPATNANNSGIYASLTFQVQDDGKIANGGVDLASIANTITFSVTAINDPPTGTNKAINLNEDNSYPLTVADFGFTDPSDIPANTLLAVKIATQPPGPGTPPTSGPVLTPVTGTATSLGTLSLSGIAVTPNQFVSAADIALGKLVYLPPANTNGMNYAQFAFLVQDNGGGDSSIESGLGHTILFNVAAINDAPAGTNKAINLNEDSNYVFAAADFGFTDPNDSLANNLLTVEISTLPTVGTLTLGNTAVIAGQLVSAANITAGNLIFTPTTNANGTNYTKFTFQVQDDGGTVGGGIDLDPTPNTITWNVTPLNDAPAGADKTVSLNEDNGYVFATTDFGFTDPSDNPANGLLAVKIATLPLAGTLKLNGVAVAADQFVSAADIAAGTLVFTPASNANGTDYARLIFQLQDDGSTANGDVNLDPTVNTIMFNVTSTNDTPTGADKTVNFNEDSRYTLLAADFGFSDLNDAPANHLLAVKITTTPSMGTLILDSTPIIAGESVGAADLAAGKLVFTPALNVNGAAASFTFQVRDNGGIANGSINLSSTANTITFNASAVNDAPSGADKIVRLNEDSSYAFSGADFQFTDPNDNPANNLLAVKIATLPAGGILTLNDAAVATGQSISAADLTAGNLIFTPAANVSGVAAANLTFQVQDDGGTANNGVDLDPTTNMLTFNIKAVNDAPAGANKTVTLSKDGSYTLTAADFGFTDPTDALLGNNLLAVNIVTLPTAGTLMLDSVSVTAGQSVDLADNLVFTPAPNTQGMNYARFTFQVQDDGGTSNGGIDLDPTANRIAFNVIVNNSPTGNVSIAGTTIQGQTLVASNTLADADGLGIISYQWQANGININNATDSHHFLTAAEVGKTVTVIASYIDGLGTTESRTSNATMAVAWNNNQVGTAGNDVLKGTESSDILSGLGGNDLLNGLSGNDTLLGGAGNDILNGEQGADKMSGGSGDDSYMVDDAGDMVVEGAGAGTDTVISSLFDYTLPSNVENISLSKSGNLNGTGNALSNVLTGNAGNNTLNGRAGIDWVSYANATAGVTVKLNLNLQQNTMGGGNDTIINIENLVGSKFGDTLVGNSSSNALNGGLGKDVITGGLGKDIITGGGGADTFLYTASTESGVTAASRDLITDLSRAEGDKINVRAIDANTILSGTQTWQFVPTFTGAAGQIKFDVVNHLVLFDQNADKTAEFSIELTGVSSLAATDFII